MKRSDYLIRFEDGSFEVHRGGRRVWSGPSSEAAMRWIKRRHDGVPASVFQEEEDGYHSRVERL